MSPYHKPETPPPRVTDLSADSITFRKALFKWSSVKGASRWELFYGDPNWDGESLGNAVRYSGDMPGVKPEGEVIVHWVDLPPRMTRKWVLFSISSGGFRSPPSNPLIITPPPGDQFGYLEGWVSSLYQASWVPPDRIEFQAFASLDDPDGVDSVWVTLENSYLGSLKRDQLTNLWSFSTPENNLPGGNLEGILGHPFYIGYRDLAGFTRWSEPLYVVRIITIPPQLISPTNDSLISNPILLKWESYSALFTFTYSVEIVHVSTSFAYTLWYRRDDIPSDSTSWRVGITLPSTPLFYFWTV
ncbi:MAG: hypothetical protein ACK4OO_07910, partial [bacterium]